MSTLVINFSRTSLSPSAIKTAEQVIKDKVVELFVIVRNKTIKEMADEFEKNLGNAIILPENPVLAALLLVELSIGQSDAFAPLHPPVLELDSRGNPVGYFE